MLYAFKSSIRVYYRKSKYRYQSNWSLCSLSILSSHLTYQHQQNDQIIIDLKPYTLSKYIATSAIIERKTFLDETKAYAKELLQRIKKTLQYLDRIFAYVFYGTPMLILAPATALFGDYFPSLEELVWDYCLWSVVQLGPTFIKLAQWASTRPDLFPPRLVERLQSLQDNVRVKYNFDTVERTLYEAFGEK